MSPSATKQTIKKEGRSILTLATVKYFVDEPIVRKKVVKVLGENSYNELKEIEGETLFQIRQHKKFYILCFILYLCFFRT